MGVDPGSLVITATIGSTLLSAYGAYQQGQSASASANYNARVAENNAKIQQQNLEWSKQQGIQKEESAEMENRAKKGAIAAEQGASGITANSGSFEDVQESQKLLGQQNAINIRAQAAREAYGIETNVASEQTQAGIDRSEAKNDKSAGTLNAVTTLVGGAADVSQKWGDYTKSKSIDTYSGRNDPNISGAEYLF